MQYKATINGFCYASKLYDSDIGRLKEKVYEEIRKLKECHFTVIYEDIDGYYCIDNLFVNKHGNIERRMVK